MLRKISIRTLSLVLSVFVLASLAIAKPEFYGIRRKQTTAPLKASVVNKEKSYDPEVLKEFELVTGAFDANRNEYLLSGTITTSNTSDSSANAEKVDYLFSKKGKEFYYKLGETETVNANGIYLHIDHRAQKVLLSKQKEVVVNNGIMNSKELIKALKSEDYELLSSVTGESQTIKIINEQHVTCREYAITYNKSSKKLSRMLTRLTNLNEELSVDSETLIDLRIRVSSEDSKLEKYSSELPIQQGKAGWELKEKYSGYELIEL